jgi:hypothetical protein
MVDRAFVVPPVGHIGPITAEQRSALIANSIGRRRLRKSGRPRIGV